MINPGLCVACAAGEFTHYGVCVWPRAVMIAMVLGCCGFPWAFLVLGVSLWVCAVFLSPLREVGWWTSNCCLLLH